MIDSGEYGLLMLQNERLPDAGLESSMSSGADMKFLPEQGGPLSFDLLFPGADREEMIFPGDRGKGRNGAGSEPLTIASTEGDPDGDDDGDGIPNKDDPDSTVEVVGRRPRVYDPNIGTDTGGGGGGDSNGGVTAPPDFLNCQDTFKNEEEREDYEVAKAAAEIARKIQEMADKDLVEYSAIIFRDATGAIAYTPLVRGTASSVPNFYTDNPDVDWGSVLGVIHSHPSILFNEDMPNFRLYPTPYGDWDFFNGVQTMILNDLQAAGYSEAWATAQANQLVQFIYGATVDADGNSIYRLFRYDNSDEENQLTGDDQLNHAEEVSPTLGTCGG